MITLKLSIQFQQMAPIMATTLFRRLLGRFGSRDSSVLVELLRDWWQLGRQRLDLAALDDRTLQGIGLSRCDVEREVGKPFWHP